MSGSVSHVVCAEKALKNFIADKDERLFIVGTLFPDSCALKAISRDATHFKKVTLDDVQQENDAFRAGMLFHSLIDTTRESYVSLHNAYVNLPDSIYRPLL